MHDNWIPPDQAKIQTSSTYENAVACQAFYAASVANIIKDAGKPGLPPDALTELRKAGQRDTYLQDLWKSRIDAIVRKALHPNASSDLNAATALVSTDFAATGDTAAVQHNAARRNTCGGFETLTYKPIGFDTTFDIRECPVQP